MKKIMPLMIASLAMLVACGSGNKSSSNLTSSESSNSVVNNSNQESVTSSSSSSSNSKESSSKAGTSNSNRPSSSSSSSSKSSSSTSKDVNSSSFNNPSTIIDPETGEEIDLNGYIAVAGTPTGQVLTDWTDEMKTIFFLYLHQTYPPFMWMDGLMVSYDNLGILQAKGTVNYNAAEKYTELLTKAGYAAYSMDEGNNKYRCYGRGMGQNFMISVDLLQVKNICSINYSFDMAETTWPAEGIAQELAVEYYNGTKTVIPAYVYPNAQYYPSANGFGEIDILCLGAPSTAADDYSKVLEAEHWTVSTYQDIPGAYTATSRDKNVVMIFYHDGTGLQIIIGFGEGENYDSWEACVAAMNDFGRTELALSKDIADEILPIDTAELYEIDRSIRGSLQITAYRTISYKVQDIFDYCMKMQTTGKFTMSVKGDYYWLAANDQSYAIRLELLDYLSDTIDTTSIVFTICDYVIFEGGYVYYGQWPTAQVKTITTLIDPSLNVPAYVDENSTYHVFSDYKSHIKIVVLNPSANCLTIYKNALKDYSWTVKDINSTKYEAIDRNEKAKITVSLEGNKFIIDLDKYIKSTVTTDKAAFNFRDTAQLLSGATLTSATWNNGPVNFTVEQGTSPKSVGNYNFYSNPLRIYRNQKVTISTTEGNITKLEFYVTIYNPVDKRDISKFDKSFLSKIAISGATLDTYNADTGLVRFVVNPGVKSISFTVSASGYNDSNNGFGLTDLDVYLG